MYDNRPTAATEAMRRSNELREQRNRRAARNKRIISVSIKLALAATVILWIIHSV
jgi:hypothetical protein